jgi:hypothetical protein
MVHSNPHYMSVASSSKSHRTLYKTARTLSCAALIAVAGACAGDSLTSPTPTPAPSQGLIGGLLGLVSQLLTPVNGLLRTTVLDQPVVRSITVGSNGGVLRIPETGLTLTIPQYAVTSSTTITVTAVAGRTVAYEFQPHGLVFRKPITFTQSLASTSLLSTTSLSGGYFKEVSQLDPMTGAALINEELPARVSNGTVSFDISHFSGYMVSTGRSKTTTTAPE